MMSLWEGDISSIVKIILQYLTFHWNKVKLKLECPVREVSNVDIWR